MLQEEAPGDAVIVAGCRLGREYFQRDCINLSKFLLGQVLVRILDDGTRLTGRIVEVEAYLGGEDRAAHSYLNRLTEKNKSMFLDAGFSYVYKAYRGHTDCFNITSDKAGVPAAVLIRALEPLEGVDLMVKNRALASGQKKGTRYNICSGPAKLCQCLNITREEFDGIDLTCPSSKIWVENGGLLYNEDDIIATPRINIQYAKEWSQNPLRFVLRSRKRFLSYPLGGTLSPTNPVMWSADQSTENSKPGQKASESKARDNDKTKDSKDVEE